MKNWAAIDIGSNTVQLLVAESADNVHFRPFLQALKTTRLGAGSQTKTLPKQAIADTLAAIDGYLQMMAPYQIAGLRLIATSAVRDAVNRDDLLLACKEQLGLSIDILSGEEEAYLSFLGVSPNFAKASKPQLVIDIGGGSTELATALNGQISGRSFNIGAVRAQVEGIDIIEFIKDSLVDFNLPLGSEVLGVGGSITTAAGLLLGLDEYQRDRIDGFILSKAALNGLVMKLKPMSIEGRCGYSPLLIKRGEIIVEGLTILVAIMDNLGIERLKVCGGGVLDGCIVKQAKSGYCANNT